MTYVALLRGVNVGGKAKVPMAELKRIFEHLGCTNVKTYINSGNVIFHDSRKSSEVRAAIESQLEHEFNFQIPCQLRTHEQLTTILKPVPSNWTNDDIHKTDVLFLDTPLDNLHILEQIKYNPAIEEVRYVPGAIIWHILRQNATKGNGAKLIGTSTYSLMTVRNINTVRKLTALSATAD